ncbi:MAG: hypothetical protein KC618_07910, partial [Candidatus Omnitrophica bacterium]|nr:hypothetical protein [Candidatus Omnitrophota bacterium]
LTEMLDYLNERERKIIEMRYGLRTYGDYLTLEEVARELGITRERVRQIELNILVKRIPQILQYKKRQAEAEEQNKKVKSDLEKIDEEESVTKHQKIRQVVDRIRGPFKSWQRRNTDADFMTQTRKLWEVFVKHNANNLKLLDRMRVWQILMLDFIIEHDDVRAAAQEFLEQFGYNDFVIDAPRYVILANIWDRLKIIYSRYADFVYNADGNGQLDQMDMFVFPPSLTGIFPLYPTLGMALRELIDLKGINSDEALYKKNINLYRSLVGHFGIGIKDLEIKKDQITFSRINVSVKRDAQKSFWNRIITIIFLLVQISMGALSAVGSASAQEAVQNNIVQEVANENPAIPPFVLVLALFVLTLLLDIHEASKIRKYHKQRKEEKDKGSAESGNAQSSAFVVLKAPRILKGVIWILTLTGVHEFIHLLLAFGLNLKEWKAQVRGIFSGKVNLSNAPPLQQAVALFTATPLMIVISGFILAYAPAAPIFSIIGLSTLVFEIGNLLLIPFTKNHE